MCKQTFTAFTHMLIHTRTNTLLVRMRPRFLINIMDLCWPWNAERHRCEVIRVVATCWAGYAKPNAIRQKKWGERPKIEARKKKVQRMEGKERGRSDDGAAREGGRVLVVLHWTCSHPQVFYTHISNLYAWWLCCSTVWLLELWVLKFKLMCCKVF